MLKIKSRLVDVSCTECGGILKIRFWYATICGAAPINKEKLLLLATIYMLVPGAMPEALADNVEAKKDSGKKTSAVQAVHKQVSAAQQKRLSAPSKK